jgi:hypothetical protein
MTNDKWQMTNCLGKALSSNVLAIGYWLLAIRSELKASLRKKAARHCWRAVSVSQPTKESFLAAGLSLADPGNVLLNLSISLLLKRG